ncbi:hypothetical protein HY633_02350 [Candidatus Uhrbacteria bacterium]|nr:hypothetical protein [Candidatus Uhrbacteria bacterium]
MNRPLIDEPTSPSVSSVFSSLTDVIAEMAPELHELLTRENLSALGLEIELIRDFAYEGSGPDHLPELLGLASRLTTLVARISALAKAENVPFHADDPEAIENFVFRTQIEGEETDLREEGYNMIAFQLVEFADTLVKLALRGEYDFSTAPSA